MTPTDEKQDDEKQDSFAAGWPALGDPPVDSAACLFIDVDGTLLEFAMTPDAVRVTQELKHLLRDLVDAMGGAVALVSGRPIADLDHLFAPLQLPAAGIHGAERRSADGRFVRAEIGADRLGAARTALQSLVASRTGLLLEDKGAALALHFRKAPQAREMAQVIVSKLLADLFPDYEMLEGDRVIELKPAAMNKATAVEAFMRERPFAGRTPVFIGDDVTDFDGFAAVRRLGGIDIAVGKRVSARWSLRDPAAVREWLSRFVRRGSGPASVKDSA